MKLSNSFFLAAFLLFVPFFLLFSDLSAQKSTEYRQLVSQSQQDPISINMLTLPGQSDSTVTLATIFSIPYRSLPFKKGNRPSSNKRFLSSIELSIEVFQSNRSNLKKQSDVSLKGLDPAARAFWSDTAYAESYEQSQSPKNFLNGYLTTVLSPDIYSYVLQMRQGQESESRISRTRTLTLPSYQEMDPGHIILGENLTEEGSIPQLTLSSLGKNIRYAQNFYALAYIPNFDENANYSLELTNLNVSNGDTSKVSTIYTQELSPSDLRHNIRPTLAPSNRKETKLNLQSSEDGFSYALVEIPNEKLPNAMYRLTIRKDGEQQAVASETFRSIWVDIPTSLLSLDVAIDMLHYIVDDKTLDRLSTGTPREREKKFREFWEERDPTPDTEYNELMAEYYRRIDYAYNNFTTDNILGFNSDQGEVYIKFGAPNNIDRKFPTNGPTTEVWTYPNRKFVFQATSGFGDFRLISQQSR